MKPDKTAKIIFPLGRTGAGKQPVVLALGGELKANFTLVREGQARTFSGFGDLTDLRCLRKFRDAVLRLCRTQKIKPDLIAFDPHPLFLSSKFASELKQTVSPGSKLLAVQHHAAHAAASLAGAGIGLKERVLAVVCDGTGWGDDNTVWGCEFLLVKLPRRQRIGHLNYIPLPGGEQAIREPWRLGAALLSTAYGKKTDGLDLPWLKKKRYQVRLMREMIEKGINTPMASSAGRLFDAVSGLIGLCPKASYEAEAAIMLEQAAKTAIAGETRAYPVVIGFKDGRFCADSNSLVRAIVRDMVSGTSKARIAARFHRWFCAMLVKMCEKAREKTGVKKVALSGGVFFNAVVSRLTAAQLKQKNFTVTETPEHLRGDSGLSLGQAVFAYVSGGSGKN